VHSGRQTLRLVTDREPNFAGVDPFNKWIDRNSDDNVKEATKAESLAAASRL
jgi:ABC-2 type transport system permease protein